MGLLLAVHDVDGLKSEMAGAHMADDVPPLATSFRRWRRGLKAGAYLTTQARLPQTFPHSPEPSWREEGRRGDQHAQFVDLAPRRPRSFADRRGCALRVGPPKAGTDGTGEW